MLMPDVSIFTPLFRMPPLTPCHMPPPLPYYAADIDMPLMLRFCHARFRHYLRHTLDTAGAFDMMPPMIRPRFSMPHTMMLSSLHMLTLLFLLRSAVF